MIWPIGHKKLQKPFPIWLVGINQLPNCLNGHDCVQMKRICNGLNGRGCWYCYVCPQLSLSSRSSNSSLRASLKSYKRKPFGTPFNRAAAAAGCLTKDDRFCPSSLCHLRLRWRTSDIVDGLTRRHLPLERVSARTQLVPWNLATRASRVAARSDRRLFVVASRSVVQGASNHQDTSQHVVAFWNAIYQLIDGHPSQEASEVVMKILTSHYYLEADFQHDR